VASTTTKRGGVEVEGLAESIKALGKLQPQYRKEAVETFRDAAKDVQRRAKASGAPAGYRGPKPRIGRSATRTGAGVKLRTSARSGVPAFAAEFGEVVATVYGRPVGQYRFRRRTAPAFKPPTSSDLLKNRGGYMIQPVIRQRAPFWGREVSRRINELIDRAMRKAGVPRG
jgi:hypothetical protein